MGLVDLLLPERCAICRVEGEVLCPSCRLRLPALRPPLCERCGAPVAWPVTRCSECAGRRLAFARARAAVLYEGAAVDLVRAWKDGGRRKIASVAAVFVVAATPRPEALAVTFVPAVSERELWRGYNTAQALALELSRAWSIPAVDCLARAASPRQSGLRLAERRRNVSGAFRARRQPPERVVLVDDVYTTGATVASAAAELRRSGSSLVEVVTFARTPRIRAAPTVWRGSGPADGVR